MSESPETTPLSAAAGLALDEVFRAIDFRDPERSLAEIRRILDSPAARATVPAGPEPCKACIALGDLCGKHQREPNEAARPVPAAEPRHAHPSVHPSLCPACQAVPAAEPLYAAGGPIHCPGCGARAGEYHGTTCPLRYDGPAEAARPVPAGPEMTREDADRHDALYPDHALSASLSCPGCEAYRAARPVPAAEPMMERLIAGPSPAAEPEYPNAQAERWWEASRQRAVPAADEDRERLSALLADIERFAALDDAAMVFPLRQSDARLLRAGVSPYEPLDKAYCVHGVSETQECDDCGGFGFQPEPASTGAPDTEEQP